MTHIFICRSLLLATFDAILNIIEDPINQRVLQKAVIQLNKFTRSGEKRFSFSVVNNFHTTFLMKRESKRSHYGIYLLLELIVEPFSYISLEFYIYIKRTEISQ